ncbi:MAG TPA: NlpC/P60 family protein [Gaiellales bacterium]|jgi:cell wall-associated NlpC family hydrolase
MYVRGHARDGGARATRASILALVLAAVAMMATATQAGAASTLSAKRAEAQRVENEIMSQEAALEKQIEKYNAIHQHYLDTRHQLRDNRIVLSVARHNLARAEQALAQSLTTTYKTSGSDVLSYLLAAHSFSDLVDHVQAVQRENNANGDLIREISRTKALIAKRTAQLKEQTAQLAADQAAQAHEKQRVEAGLHALQARKARIGADIQHLIDLQQQRAQAAATAAAASSGGGGGTIPVPPSSTLGGQAVAIAEQYLGVPYVWGGASPSGFDCSGLTMYVYAQLGVSLPHNAAAQYGMGSPVPRDALEPGDLVFFDGLGHVGIYVGGGSFIHAPHTGTVVQISSLSGWYSDNYVGARRVG